MKKSFIPLLVSIVLFSCDRWEEGIARDIVLPPHNPQIAASLFIDSMDSTLSAQKLESLKMLKSNSIKTVLCYTN